ncbi:class F sortase [Domibacillus sp. DTU_2020_1001157_1_SI_ALB_TIR_016]|uniref:class F sortase n=1 Tax=Domibacillus sp. DTU_2020_1001157_1_SI_ALB_TIR_016 TaxID=3077789 RepID=UPI0028E6A522|nr:class F sortase [Domibacillus sp. DTU_2020_1001157_1_SI_ALB_TIR_016]WNS78408.1 class F sortase [Domibacillus sp. DTU_2020_1001157_1_SI_ALB_TIR_016]
MKSILLLGAASLICFLLFGYTSSYISHPSVQSKEQKQTSADAAEEPPEFTLLDEEVQKLMAESKKTAANSIVPASVEMPAIGVNAVIEPVGILENGQMGVPKEVNNVGWFEPGIKPGNVGNAVLAGHVDSQTGPAVFFDLKKLEKGDEVIVKNAEGKQLTFVVQSKRSYERNSAPINEVFGSSDEKKLNLITCTGRFDRSEGTHEERLVVYTKLKEDPVQKPFAPTNVEVHGTFVSWHAVREKTVVGYRIYREENGQFKHVASISAFERKSYSDPEAQNHRYYVTSVDKYNQESKPSEITPKP